MKVGVDSYCFHRYFGEIYEGLQADPGVRWSMEDFLRFADELKVESVSLESCFMPALDRSFLREMRAELDAKGIHRVMAWGHPDGLEGGSNEEQYAEMLKHLEAANLIGASVMRIAVSSMAFRSLPHGPQIENLIRMLSKAVRVGEEFGVAMAIENHADYTSTELLQILDAVNSPFLGINFDSGNALRVFEDPVVAATNLAPWTKATHIKDICIGKGSPHDFAFWPSAPSGKGIVDLPGVVRALKHSGYDGPLTLEIDLMGPGFEHMREEEIVTQSVAYLRTLIDIT